MAYYRRMGSVEEHLGGNAVSIVSLRYQLRDLWRSPRGTVLRIEALALVAIILSFFLAFFVSCRRWSNRWIVQKGFLAAQVLSLSLGTYSIGLMQSSPVKSEMYPIWAVSLLTLFGCVDPVTTYIGLDFKGPLSKMIFQLCLYFGYVMLMGVTTFSSGIGKLAIGVLSTITFIKSFHRSLVFMLPGEIRRNLEMVGIGRPDLDALAGCGEGLIVYLPYRRRIVDVDIDKVFDEGNPANDIRIKSACLSYSFSHQLRRRFLGLISPQEMMGEPRRASHWLEQDGSIYCRQVSRVVEIELAFLFEAFFTSNEFLHLYQAKTGSFWALASFIGICFVVVEVAIIPSRHIIINSAAATGAVTIVGTTAVDLIITLVILVSLALLQLVQLIRCWTSNWARVGIACEYAIANRQVLQDEGDWPNDDHSNTRSSRNNQIISRWVMGLRLFLVARVNWFDKYLWQARLGQDSLAELLQRRRTRARRGSVFQKACCCCGHCPAICDRWLYGVGVLYFYQVIDALFLSDATNPGGAVRLHNDVKASITKFLGTAIKFESRRRGRIGVEWSALFVQYGLEDWFECLPYIHIGDDVMEAYAFTQRFMIWHIATWYCEEAEKAEGGNRGGAGEDSSSREKNRRVAMDLSKYCAYLVVSAPELLPGPATDTKKALDKALRKTEKALRKTEYALHGKSNGITILEAMHRASSAESSAESDDGDAFFEFEFEFELGVDLGKRLRNEATTAPPTPPEGRPGGLADHWELLALLWVQTLLYAAPYGDVQAHMQRLAQGGEFITHLWALLFHLGIGRWEAAGIDELKGGAAAAETTTRRGAYVEGDAVSGGVETEEIS